MNADFEKIIEAQLHELGEKGLFKYEQVISSQQGREIMVGDKKYLNFCSNNYLGFSADKALIEEGKKALDVWGFGLSSVRFICGTLTIHKDLEKKLAKFMGYQDTILYNSCFDANISLFQIFFDDQDMIICDELNHASLIDGVRLSRADRVIFKHSDMQDLEEKLKAANHKRFRAIVTDGVFSMEGDVANMEKICNLADKYNALVIMDDSHATGIMGKSGRGTHEYTGVKQRIDFITSTFGKALGGASGGFIVSSKQNIEFLRQRSRNYLFSNSLPPVIVKVTSLVIDMISNDAGRRQLLWENTQYFREKMSQAGFIISKTQHPIIPIILGDAKVAKNMAEELLREGVYVISFSYPVVPLDSARIRVQLSACHTKQDIDFAVSKFVSVAKKLQVIT